MNSTNFCLLFGSINWLWYVVAVIAVFALGGIWFSFLFQKAWIKVFKIEMPEGKPKGVVFTMLMQFVVTALFGLVFFVLVKLSFWVALLALIGFCGWQKGSLKFRYTKWSEYFQAAIIEAGYTFLAGMIFILLGLL